jgi:hypothetical protein
MGCDVASKAEAASLLTGRKFGKLPRCPRATVSFWSNQDSELSHHGNDVVLLTKRRIINTRGIHNKEVEDALSQLMRT